MSEVAGEAERTDQDKDAQVVEPEMGKEGLVTHRGGCHCGAVRFEVQAAEDLTAWDCNCSICRMKRNTHFIVPVSRFHLLQGAKSLSTYTFGTHTAKHKFCKVCGICPFYVPRSNPDGFAVTVHCLDPGTVRSVDVCAFDGAQWERFIDTSGIRAMSTG
eukprot:jgi/Chlat1/6234/Chrsp44S05767